MHTYDLIFLQWRSNIRKACSFQGGWWINHYLGNSCYCPTWDLKAHMKRWSEAPLWEFTMSIWNLSLKDCRWSSWRFPRSPLVWPQDPRYVNLKRGGPLWGHPGVVMVLLSEMPGKSLPPLSWFPSHGRVLSSEQDSLLVPAAYLAWIWASLGI